MSGTVTAVMPQPEPPLPHSSERAAWPCRYCRERDSVRITLRQPGTLVCFCRECEQGWCTDERGRPRD